MSAGLLYLNDYRSQLFTPDGPAATEPAILVASAAGLLSGEAASQRARIEPSNLITRHWQQLNQQPLTPARAGFRHHADLAFRQLGVWLAPAPSELPLVIAQALPLDADQQSLLAGLVQAHGYPLQALAPSALIQAAGHLIEHPQPEGTFYHLELCRHAALLSELTLSGGQLTLVRQMTLADQGAQALENRWMNLLARECVRQTRYDPLHSAAAEQRLFNQLYPALHALQAGETTLVIDDNRVKMDPHWLEPLCSNLRETLAGHVASAPVLLSPIACELPLMTGLPLAEDCTHRGFTQLLPQLSEGPLRWHHQCTLPRRHSSSPKTHARATHLLAGHRAFPLVSPLYLNCLHGDWVRADKAQATFALTQTEGQWQWSAEWQSSGAPGSLQAGDSLTHPQWGQLRLICLEETTDGA